jgi:tetratricopeptide (TPR) repeat protein
VLPACSYPQPIRMSTAAVPATSSSLETAQAQHAQGNLLGAAESYCLILQSNPNSQQALLGLSLIARQSNQLQPALRMAEAALAANPASALAWANLGDARIVLHHISQAHISQAKTAFRHALTLQPNLAAAHYGLGNALALEGNFPEALTRFTAAAEIIPDNPECHFASAFAHGKLGDHGLAIAAYRNAVRLRPDFASAWLNLGVELAADGRDHLAEPCYRQAFAATASGRPAQTDTHISAYLNLGHLHRGRGHFLPAQQHYETALGLAIQNDPRISEARLAEIHVAFTYLHLEQQQFPQAWQALRHAEAANPRPMNPEIPNARGILLLAEHTALFNPDPYPPLIEEAIAAFQQAEFQGHKTAASNRGNALLRLGRVAEALAAHQAALDPDAGGDRHHPGIRYNLALTQLRAGDFVHGWPNYEVRWQFREVHPRPRRFTQPRWQGEPLPAHARLLIYSEQGLGDTLQFLRYLPLVAERSPNTHLILEVQSPLTRLLAPNLTAEVLPQGQPLPPFTHHCPLLSLPAIFQTTSETVPARTPYLRPDDQLTRQRAAELALTGNLRHPAIGLNWAGNPRYRADHERSTRLDTFLQILQIPGIRWISLQKGEAAHQIAHLRSSISLPHISLTDCSSGDRDLADTAALIANLDLVITTDTAIAHLAGALGKPLWLLLPWQSDWRWMQDTAVTPWYPTARLFRQSSPNNWPELLDRISQELHHQFATTLSIEARS